MADAKKEYELITVIVNVDFAEIAIEASQQAGARGATIINAHGSGSKEAGLLMGLKVTPEKDVVLIVVESSMRDAVMTAIGEKVGLSMPGQGIIFSQKIDSAIGLA